MWARRLVTYNGWVGGGDGEHMLKMIEHRMLQKVFGSRRDEVTGDCSRLHNENFIICNPPRHHLCKQIKENKTGGRCGSYVGMTVACRCWVWDHKGKRLLGRPCCRW